MFTFVGRIVPIKRVDLLIGAFARAARAIPGLRLLVVGDGEARTRLELLAAELGVGDRVTLHRLSTGPGRIAAAADVAVISSDNEGTPVSLIEAAAAGVPAVATNVGGVGSIVDEDTGMLVAKGNEAALAEAMQAIAADRGLRRRLGVGARARALARFSIDRLIGDTDALYGELLARADERPAGRLR